MIPVEQIAPAEVAELDLYQKREKIYTRNIEGFFQRLRLYTGWPLLLGYFLLPWLNWRDRPAVLFDLPARQFHILGLTFWPQDFPLLAWLLIIAAFALFAVTVWAGRVWCGYTCPQTVWTAIYMWAEQIAEGSRNQRIKLDQARWNLAKFARKSLKHGMWLGFALLTGITFVGYFSPIRALGFNLLTLQLGFWEAAWIIFFTGATYINAGWLREQVCLYMCPYARFQSAMFDRDTLIVSYDAKRGEPRGARKKGSDPRAQNLGDCIDCQLCVQVCPTGIDIRNGLQYQCINCALCIDGCDAVMDKMGYARGLIRYTTENALSGQPYRWLRPRLLGYSVALLIMIALFVFNLSTRVPLHVDVLRERQQLYRQTSDGLIENTYTLKIINMDTAPHAYRIRASGLAAAMLTGPREITVGGSELQEVALRLSIDPGLLQKPHTEIEFEVEAIDQPRLHTKAESRFIGPFTGPGSH
ncbi:MAG TPA: cytochrome c oxidase accessory protein CcoG [Spongiibacteraceae bacterium]|nr:cytochrome c oxidase accessory protein CcoG [Spongiibacteraceae bacterium]